MAKQFRTCSVDGCNKPVYGKGLCNAHRLRQRRHGDPLAGRTPTGTPQQFYDEIVLSYEGDECLTWPFARFSRGYGNMHGLYVHRLICEAVHGAPPTKDHQAAHSCGKGHEGCVAKRHLSWKTRKENSNDMIAHGTLLKGEKQPMAKLTEQNVRDIRALRGTMSARLIGIRFCVCGGAVHDILSGRNWGWLE